MLDSSPSSIQALVEEKALFLKKAIEAYSHPAKIIVTLLDSPLSSPFGIRDPIQKFGFLEAILAFNKSLVELSRKNPHVLLLDFEKVASGIGKREMTDEKLYYLGKVLLTNAAAKAMASEIAKLVSAIYGQRKKCIVVDLDNTLWGGVVGEEGPVGIAIGDAGIGSIYRDVQSILLSYRKMGVLLAIASKNNPDDALSVFRENKAMVLREDDFVCMRISWDPKSKGILDIAEELNIGLDSLVFIDDNPAERLEVKAHLPMVEVVDVPSDIALLPRMLRELPFFESISITEEDKKRHDLYQQEKKRTTLMETLSVDDYLMELGMIITIKKDDIPSLERITQLINKTNQFNLRTKRYSAEEVGEMMASKEKMVLSLSVSDKFGDLGLTGVIILAWKKPNECFIDSFLMSCRILGRKIEQQFFIEAMDIVKKKDRNTMVFAEYLPTQKNGMAKDFYERMGFLAEEKKDGRKEYVLNLSSFDSMDIPSIQVKHG